MPEYQFSPDDPVYRHAFAISEAVRDLFGSTCREDHPALECECAHDNAQAKLCGAIAGLTRLAMGAK